MKHNAASVGMASAVCWRNSKGALTETARKASEEFNRNILRSHSVGFGPYLDKEIVRLSMVIRLNTLLTGRAGV